MITIELAAAEDTRTAAAEAGRAAAEVGVAAVAAVWTAPLHWGAEVHAVTLAVKAAPSDVEAADVFVDDAARLAWHKRPADEQDLTCEQYTETARHCLYPWLFELALRGMDTRQLAYCVHVLLGQLS